MKQMPPTAKCPHCGKLSALSLHGAQQTPEQTALSNVRAKMRTYTNPPAAAENAGGADTGPQVPMGNTATPKAKSKMKGKA